MDLKKYFYLLGGLVALWLGVKYLLPVAAPFVAGTVIALLSEPAVGLASGKLKLPRSLGSGIGVTVTLLLWVGVLSAIGTVVVRQLSVSLPDLGETASQGILYVQDLLLSLTQQAPESLQPALTGSVLRLFDNGNAVIDAVTKRASAALTKVITWVPDGAMGVGTALLSAFLISARLPRLKKNVWEKLPQSWKEKYIPNMKKAGKAAAGWLKAQLRLSAITYLIVGVGFAFLRIPNGFLWALVVAVVDAVPILGTGTILIPWGIVRLLQKEMIQGAGLLLLCGIAMLTRTVLEPRLVGKQLGLDPLVTLIALYFGYCLLGIFGLLFAPILVSVVKNVVLPQKEQAS
jgi:sporulation integral membrane protein YtvI